MVDFSEIKADTQARMEKTLDSLKADFGGLRAGRAMCSYDPSVGDTEKGHFVRFSSL